MSGSITLANPVGSFLSVLLSLVSMLGIMEEKGAGPVGSNGGGGFFPSLLFRGGFAIS